MTDITASFETLMDQGGSTASFYMRRAVREIDDLFGEGYAKANPSLVAAFMQAAAADCGASVTAKVIGSALEEIALALSSR